MGQLLELGGGLPVGFGPTAPFCGPKTQGNGDRKSGPGASRGVVHRFGGRSRAQTADQGSLSFGRGFEGLHGLLEAVGEFAARAAVKLRKQGSVAGQVFGFAQTSPFRPPPHFSRGLCVPLASASADTRVLVAAAHAGVRAIFQSGVEFNKAGVFLLDLCPANRRQEAFEFGETQSEIDERLMATVDHLDQRSGRGR